MRRFSPLLLIVLMLAVVGAAVAGDEAKQVTIEGTLIGTKCYGMNNDNVYNDHMTPDGNMPKCAEACARMGIPVGVLIDGKKGGDVYILVTPSIVLADHMAKQVKVTGMEPFAGSLSIIPEKVWVKNDKDEWEEVKIATMM